MTHYCRIKGTLATKTVYTCHICKRQEEGTQHDVEIDCGTSEEVQATLEKAGQKSHDMPYGWCYTGVYTCAQCLVRDRLGIQPPVFVSMAHVESDPLCPCNECQYNRQPMSSD